MAEFLVQGTQSPRVKRERLEQTDGGHVAPTTVGERDVRTVRRPGDGRGVSIGARRPSLAKATSAEVVLAFKEVRSPLGPLEGAGAWAR